ncbi:MAG: hypothetical protein GEU26_19260 [Nitrososphaeraceae archaeon]|nr:hypothetical protein [Nitrososphaeraceae archaeon]
MIALVITVMVGFTISDTMVAIAQPNDNISRNNTTALNSTDSDGKNIVVTWLESNKTNTNGVPTIRVSNEDFWKIFGPLFELSTNTTRE